MAAAFRSCAGSRRSALTWAPTAGQAGGGHSQGPVARGPCHTNRVARYAIAGTDDSNSDVAVFRYPPGTLLGDYIRAGAGFGVGVAALLTVPVGWATGLFFGGLATVFGLFGARTIQRHITQVAVTNDEIARAAVGTRVLPWDELGRVKLRYYGSRWERKRSSGFMQLTLWGGGTKLVFESNLDGFDFIVWCAARAARTNGISLDPPSVANMLALGIDADGEAAPPKHVADLAARLARDPNGASGDGAP